MNRIVSPQKLAQSFIHIKDNYVLEIATGKTWAIVKLYEPEYGEMYQLVEPMKFEDNIEKIAKSLKSFFEKIKKKEMEIK